MIHAERFVFCCEFMEMCSRDLITFGCHGNTHARVSSAFVAKETALTVYRL
jgi:hypothetical protein